MTEIPSRWERCAAAVLIAAPVLSLALSGAAWLHYGIDLPFYDDFRAYARRTALSLDPRDLFAPANDTLYPVGMALDVLAQRFLNGNAVAYQFISMMVLMGGLLLLQWRLLSSALEDRLLAASAFSLCVFMTWPESYWGLQSMAYHHGLPLLFLLGAVTAIAEKSWSPRWGVPAVFILGLLAGFSYISGAVASLAVATVLILAWAAGLPRIPGLRAGGFALLAAAAISVPAQVWVILFVQQGRIHDPGVGWSMPTEASFWMFMLGKIGRGLALPYHRPVLSLIVTLLVVALAILLAALLLLRVRRERAALPAGAARVTLVFMSLAALAAAYLPLIAAGRANILAPDPKTLLGMYAHGLPEHYHAVWVTLLFPWIGAALALRLQRRPLLARLRTSLATPLASAALVAAAAEAGAFSHHAHFRNVETFRLRADVPCVRKALTDNVVACPEWYAPELIDMLRFGRQIGASFVRYFPLQPVAIGTDDPPPLYRLSATPPLRWENVSLENLTGEVSGDDVSFTSTVDPRLFITLPAGSLRACWEVEVNVEMKAQHTDFAELYVLKPGQGDFRAPPAAVAQVRSDRFTIISLYAYSLDGLLDRIRIDPVGDSQPFAIRNLEVRCRGLVPGQSG